MALRRHKQRSAGLVTQTSKNLPAPPESDDAELASPHEQPVDVAEGQDLPTPKGRIGEILLKQGSIDERSLAAAVDAQEAGDDRRLGEILREAGGLTDVQVTAGLGEQYGLSVVDANRVAVDPRPEAILLEDQARALGAVPLARSAGQQSVLIADPAMAGVFADIAGQVGRAVGFVLAPPIGVAALQDKAYQASAVVSDAVRVFEARTAERTDAAGLAEISQVDANAPIVQVVNTILSQAVRDNASDVHIEPMGERVRIRNRIDGALHEVLSLPQAMALALVSRIKIMAEMNIVERRRPQDGQMEAVIEGTELDIRVSTTATQYGEKTVLRILDKARALFDLAELGMTPEFAEIYSDIIRSPYGMVVCAGPTGSGKTTTLYASLMAINSDEINVMTVEDPVEYSFPTINQISIHEQAGVTFAAGLRSILRQDPDAILVGEIRDVETARIAIQAALTGHFVLSTIHATDATSALHRFLDMGIESFLLASSMLAVVGQRLIRRSCQDCLEPYDPAVEELDFFDRAGGSPPGQFMRGSGCHVCSGTGYSGRIGVYEVLRVTDEMRDLIVRNATLNEIRALAVDQGMVPMRDQALRLVAEDGTTIAEVMRTIYIA